MKTEAPPRPTLTREIIMEAAKLVAKQLPNARRGGRKTLGQNDADDELETATDIADMYADLSRSAKPDGYDLAKALDSRRSWECQLEDADKLDNMAFLINQSLRETEKKWVAEYNVKPSLPVGTEIKPIGPHCGKHVISSICEFEPARYLVKVDGKEGYSVVKFEDAEAIV